MIFPSPIVYIERDSLFRGGEFKIFLMPIDFPHYPTYLFIFSTYARYVCELFYLHIISCIRGSRIFAKSNQSNTYHFYVAQAFTLLEILQDQKIGSVTRKKYKRI